MKQHRLTSVVAGIALLLGIAPMTLVYKGLLDWFVPVTLTVVMVIGASIGARALRLNAALQVVAMFLGLLLALTWQFSNGGAILGVFPGPGTFENFGLLMGQAGEDIREQVMPVDATEALVFLLVVGVGAMAVLTEVFTSIMRIPALVGIPLLMLYLIPMALLAERIPWVLFIPGALGFLWLLLTDNIDRVRRYGRRFSGDGRGIDRWEPSPLAGTGRWLAILVVGLALLVPVLVPGINANMLAGLGGGNGPGGSGGGGSKAVSPWAMLEGGLSKPTPQDLGVIATTGEQDPGYLKMWNASKLTSDGFGPDTDIGTEAYPASQGLEPEDPEGVEANVYNATFRSTGLDDTALPLYSYATNVEVSDEWKYDPVSDTVTSESATTKDLEYDFTYTRYQYTPEQLREAPDVPQSSQEFRFNTGRPEIEAVGDLTGKLTDGKDNQYDKVRAIFDHFSTENGFTYSLETKTKQDVSAIEAFLDNKEGYCQQYAAAMGWMVREAGFPARVSIGLTTGTKTEDGYEVSSDNFHAWVEVYFQGYGWIPFDPTPSSGVAGSAATEWAPDPNDTGDDGSSDDGGDGNNDDGATDEPGPDKSDRSGGDGSGTERVTLAAKLPPPVWPYWLAGGAVAAIVVLVPGFARSLRRRRRLSVPESRPVEAAEAAWRELCDSLTDLRIPVDESETARGLARRLIHDTGIDGPAATGAKHLAAAQEHSRYGPRPPAGLTLRHASRAARFGLAATQSRFAQLRADFIPASLVMSWTSGIRGGLSAMSNGTTRVLMALNRLIPKRGSAAPQ